MKKKKRRIFVVFLAVLLLAAGYTGIRVIRRHGDKGVTLKAAADHPLPDTVYFFQKDSRWKEDHLGASRFTMESSGCLTSCIASALSTQHQVSGIGSSITAGELNLLFSENQVYNEQGDIVWNQIEKALPDTEVLTAGSVDAAEIETLLAKGCYPVVKVRVHGTGAFHWVLILGSEDGVFFCMDPLREEQMPVPLTEFGEKGYRMRCVSWKPACAIP